MFLQKLRTLCHECDWIVKCGRTRNGYAALRQYAADVCATGSRSRIPARRAFADALANVIVNYSDDDLIDTFAGII
jgi:hypothetical protein